MAENVGIFSFLQIVFIYLMKDILPITAGCIDQSSTNSTTDDCTPALPSQTPYPNGNKRQQEPTYNVFYAAAIFLGVIGVPMVILFRICWIRRLNTQHRLYSEQQRHHNEDGVHGHPFTINVDPAGYLPSYEQSIADAPPPYDVLELPPPYKLKKDKSSASLPSYSAEDNNLPCTTNSISETNRTQTLDEQNHTSLPVTHDTENNR